MGRGNEEATEHGARREFIEGVGDPYRRSERAKKKKILDEFLELAGHHRKPAIRVLRAQIRIGTTRQPDTSRKTWSLALRKFGGR